MGWTVTTIKTAAGQDSVKFFVTYTSGHGDEAEMWTIEANSGDKDGMIIYHGHVQKGAPKKPKILWRDAVEALLKLQP